MAAMLIPRLLSNRPIEATVTPLPTDETTPPVTKMYFGIPFASHLTIVRQSEALAVIPPCLLSWGGVAGWQSRENQVFACGSTTNERAPTKRWAPSPTNYLDCTRFAELSPRSSRLSKVGSQQAVAHLVSHPTV